MRLFSLRLLMKSKIFLVNLPGIIYNMYTAGIIRLLAILISFSFRPSFYAGLYVLLGTDIILPPQTPVIHDDVNCQILNKPAPMTLFAYRAHTHSHGTSINGYLYRSNDIQEIVRGNLSQPQIFYPIPNKIEVDNGDSIACRCIYNTSGENNPISIGLKIYHLLKMCSIIMPL